MHKRFFLTAVLCCLFVIGLYSQNTEEKSDVSLLPDGTAYKIESVEYSIKGFTKVGPLSAKVPIDKNRMFTSREEFDAYIAGLNSEFNNIRTIESHEITFDFLQAQNNIVPVKLKISIQDTWNIIALPYPSFDSNSGLEFKLKLKDFNFLGSLEPLTMDLIYNRNNNEKSSFALGSRFTLPFHINPVKLFWSTNVEFKIDQDKNFGFDFETGLSTSYKFGFDWLTLNAGTMQGVNVSASPYKKDYYLTNGFYTSLVFDIYKNPVIGTITWSPYFGIKGDWKFKKMTDDEHKGLNILWSHSFGMGKVNWVNNFRQGFNLKFNNDYKYNTYRKGNVEVSFELESAGFYSFLDRIGLYGRFDFYYNLFNKTSEKSGKVLRGILNNRIPTDTAINFNFDLPIKIGVFKWEEITGVSWTRFFGFEMHISPFVDIALVHDKATNTYYNPKYGWYSGGFEIILYPIKMRSIYARISYGHDLREIKNKTGRAKRDGRPVSEIFIGIGLHY
ncbi:MULTISPECIES: hypothetical protein [unclassified Treponema]|uniref:hypothetical protein n=1 Tax=unclassified Treponema TaxID=2638727 RepID=UPI0020A346CA|nr:MULTISPECIES: hypothetical protein [unclassified Treponema]UTC66399.1 hypothetical protein E4O06_10535 [Treponema sp. OMZ 789]UTC69129.1 hypothetical protein E4O01_10680 [Treponema sp. OMZ 790]UTC71841.1 hypothetical protein E4O02_10770 [Treponema sp. OMZ 791]